MKKRLLLTLLPMAFLMAACGGSEPAPSTTSHATGLSTTTSTPTSAPTSTSEPDPTSTSEPDPTSSTSAPTSYTIECYVKKGTEVVTWWNDASAVTYAYIWNGEGEEATNKEFLAATFVEAYDEGKTLYFTVQVTEIPEKILLIRCNPEVVTELPMTWPEEGVWNQTNDGAVNQKTDEESGEAINEWYADLTIKS